MAHYLRDDKVLKNMGYSSVMQYILGVLMFCQWTPKDYIYQTSDSILYIANTEVWSTPYAILFTTDDKSKSIEITADIALRLWHWKDSAYVKIWKVLINPKNGTNRFQLKEESMQVFRRKETKFIERQHCGLELLHEMRNNVDQLINQIAEDPKHFTIFENIVESVLMKFVNISFPLYENNALTNEDKPGPSREVSNAPRAIPSCDDLHLFLLGAFTHFDVMCDMSICRVKTSVIFNDKQKDSGKMIRHVVYIPKTINGKIYRSYGIPLVVYINRNKNVDVEDVNNFERIRMEAPYNIRTESSVYYRVDINYTNEKPPVKEKYECIDYFSKENIFERKNSFGHQLISMTPDYLAQYIVRILKNASHVRDLVNSAALEIYCLLLARKEKWTNYMLLNQDLSPIDQHNFLIKHDDESAAIVICVVGWDTDVITHMEQIRIQSAEWDLKRSFKIIMIHALRSNYGFQYGESYLKNTIGDK